MTKVQRLHPEAVLPTSTYPGDAGMDLCVVGDHVLAPGESRDLPTGIAVQMPDELWGRITGRSSTLRKRGLFVNEGVIDNGYRGELLVYVTNRQSTPVEISSGDRLAQLILQPVFRSPAAWAEALDESKRGTNGFGSTGHRTIEVPGLGGMTDLQAGLDITSATMDALQDTSRTSPKPTFDSASVYLGGAVDVGDPDENHQWRHQGWMVATYCPICHCKDLRGDEAIIRQNMLALDHASDAVFVMEAFSVGTPIEAWHRIILRRHRAIIVWPRHERSVFIDHMGRQPDVLIVPTIDSARRVTRDRARVTSLRDT